MPVILFGVNGVPFDIHWSRKIVENPVSFMIEITV